MQPIYEIFSYSHIKPFIAILQEKKIVDKRSAQNEHFLYLADYFHKIGVKTVLIEPEYVDRDYLEDYSRYYSKCFQKYSKWCTRIHFFSSSFTKEEFYKKLSSPDWATWTNNLQTSYLGFIVLRPIPKTLFGRICLTIYSELGSFFPVLCEYKAHIMGIEFKVNTLACQEQDNAISACATTALWSAFQGTGKKTLQHTPSPYEITLNAKNVIGDSRSIFPNRGLLPSQMAYAVKEEGLEPLMVQFSNTSYLKALLRAYLHAKIPVILGFTLRFENEEGKYFDSKLRKKPIGDHAVTVTGYHLTSEIKAFNMTSISYHKSEKDKPMFLRSSGIDKIYVHDDQLGPLAQMTFRDEYWQHMTTEWYQYRPNKSQREQINATIKIILFPLYHKIRIRFNTIFLIIKDFHDYYTSMWSELRCTITWDIYLTTVCELKKQILQIPTDILGDKESRLKMLAYKMPRYIWVVDTYTSKDKSDKKLSFSFYFDATDIENSDLFICALHYDRESYEIIHREAIIVNKNKILKEDGTRNYQASKILSLYRERNDNPQIIKPSLDLDLLF